MVRFASLFVASVLAVATAVAEPIRFQCGPLSDTLTPVSVPASAPTGSPTGPPSRIAIEFTAAQTANIQYLTRHDSLGWVDVAAAGARTEFLDIDREGSFRFRVSEPDGSEAVLTMVKISAERNALQLRHQETRRGPLLVSPAPRTADCRMLPRGR